MKRTLTFELQNTIFSLWRRGAKMVFKILNYSLKDAHVAENIKRTVFLHNIMFG